MRILYSNSMRRQLRSLLKLALLMFRLGTEIPLQEREMAHCLEVEAARAYVVAQRQLGLLVSGLETAG